MKTPLLRGIEFAGQEVPGAALRDQIAIAAMNGLIQIWEVKSEQRQARVAILAYKIADAMLLAREGKLKNEEDE